MSAPDLTAGAKAIRPLMPGDVKRTAWEALDEPQRDRLREIVSAAVAAALPEGQE